MRLEDSVPAPTLYTASSGATAPAAGLRPLNPARPFGELLAQARQAAPVRTVASGDTLVAIVREQAAQRGVALNGAEALRQAQQLARDSGISDPGRIFPGQKLALGGLHNRLAALSGSGSPGPAAPAAQVLARNPAANAALAAATGMAAGGASQRLGAAAYASAAPAANAVSAASVASSASAATSFKASNAANAAIGPRPAAAGGLSLPASASPGSPVTATVAAGGTAGGMAAATALAAAQAAVPGPAQGGLASAPASVLAAGLRPVALRAAATAGTEAPGAQRHFLAGPHPVLEQTLDRAVARGFIPAIERGDVYDKILDLAARHRFRPDDFARMTLMESDGMNPRASNERCHGIIQFCDGNDRGAATAGYAANPRAILGFSVYQQLHLVDKYFSEVGVKPAGGGAGPANLDDLYLAVLMPAARSNTDAHAPLAIPGPQASYLHVGRDRNAPITRQSILEGLRENAADRLSSFAQRMRPQALREDFMPGATRLR